ncbi:hypothetical protein DYD83_18395 [Dickeya fangzhongdai]|uniref:Uncharacterized protein n=1 Tax=Dickeya fangzhongdai TaxID=1778540 RepID=A0A2K8QQG5_9GAMM|nr:hypothetical protein CVE23_18320 [Dickeya fangzhongdai]QOH49198.1 hypothetical protein DYD82_18395 [Dickeya fangzhongdai]QOH53501.1 hypothetical protein DYD83_18395 [Dickeya fangzhongdai]
MEAKLRRYAVPSAFAFAVRAACDVLPARHRLSPRPCGSPGEVAHLSVVFNASNPANLCLLGSERHE